MPTIDYPSELGIADYFSEDVQGSVLVSIDHLASGRAEQSALHSSAKILFVLTYRLKSQSITLACVALLVFHELNSNHLALVTEIAGQSRKRHLNKLLVVPLAHVGILFHPAL